MTTKSLIINQPVSFKGIGQFLTTATILLSVVYSFLQKQLIGFLETNISPDHSMDPLTQSTIPVLFYFIMILLFVLGIYWWKIQNTVSFLKIEQAVFAEPFSKLILIVSSFTGLFLFINFFIWTPFDRVRLFLYREDGLFEWYTSIVLFAAVVLLGFAIWRLMISPMRFKWRGYLITFFAVILLGALFDGGEEISWGQRVFGWETPKVLDTNIQHESNLHNLIQPSNWPWLYLFLALPLVFVLISAWLGTRPGLDFWKKWILPHPNLIGISFILGYTALVTERYELMEELFASFVLFYALKIYINTIPEHRKNGGLASSEGGS